MRSSVTPWYWLGEIEVLEKMDDADCGLCFNWEENLGLLYIAEAGLCRALLKIHPPQAHRSSCFRYALCRVS